MKRAVLALAAGLALSACVRSASGEGMLPPGSFEGAGEIHFRGYREPPLWRPEALRGYRSRARLSTSGILRRDVAVRLDEHRDGRITGHVVALTRNENGIVDREVRSVNVARADYEALERLAARAQLWAVNRQRYISGDEGICLDGIEMMFERADAQGYRVASANSACTATRELRQFAERIYRIAGDRRMIQIFGSDAP